MRNIFVSILLILQLTTITVVSQSSKETKSTCEEVSLTLDVVANKLLAENNDSKLIIIARLGKTERDLALSVKRQFAVKKYLMLQGVKSNQIIFAMGVKTKGLGSLSLYTQDSDIHQIVVGKNDLIPVGYCESSRDDADKFQMKVLKKKDVRRKYGRL